MRGFVIAVLAAFAAVAVTAIAYAQYTPPQHTMTATVSPRTADKSVRVDIGVQTAPATDGTVGSFTYLFPSELKLSTRGFPFCTPNTIRKNAGVDSRCPTGSRVGSGSARAFVASRSGTPILFDVRVYAGSERSLTLVFAGKGDFQFLKAAFPATLAGPVGDFRQSLTANIPAALQRVRSADAVLDMVNISIRATRRARVKVRGRYVTRTYRLVTSRTCGSRRQWLLGTSLEYSRPAGSVSRQEATVACTRPA